MKIKSVSLEKINRKFEKRYGVYSYDHYWKVKVKDASTRKSYKFKVTVNKENKNQIISIIFDNKKLNKEICDKIVSEAKDLLITYLITK